MKALGCLTILVLIGVGIFLLASSQDMTDEQKAQWVGQKAHRGWNRVRQILQHAQQGWKSTEQKQESPQDSSDR